MRSASHATRGDIFCLNSNFYHENSAAEKQQRMKRIKRRDCNGDKSLPGRYQLQSLFYDQRNRRRRQDGV